MGRFSEVWNNVQLWNPWHRFDKLTPLERWLIPERLRVYPRIFFIAFVGESLWKWWQYADGIRHGNLPDIDFTVFWLASKATASGHIVMLYDPRYLYQLLHPLSSSIRGNYGWFYPPFLFIALVAPGGAALASGLFSVCWRNPLGLYSYLEALVNLSSNGLGPTGFPGTLV
jgi:hypothetical protein